MTNDHTKLAPLTDGSPRPLLQIPLQDVQHDLEQRTGCAIAPELLYDYQTVRTLAAYLAVRMAPPQAA